MKRRQDLLTGLLVALLLHIGIALCAGGLLAPRLRRMRPDFKQGESSLELTLEPSSFVSEPEPEPLPDEPPDATMMLTEPGVGPAIVPEPLSEDVPNVSSVDNNADMLNKGLREKPELATDVRPVYPLYSRLKGEEGSVAVRVQVDSRGRVRSLSVVQSSGYSALDRQAIKALRQAEFLPAERGGRPRAGETTVTILFKFK